MNKTRKTLIAMVIAIITIVTIFTGCNSNQISDYSFWEKENQVRITLPIKVDVIQSEDNITNLGTLKLPGNYLKRVQKLQKAMISYFQKEYNIDISEKIEKQKLRVFVSSGDEYGEMTMGYVDTSKPNYLNLNGSLLAEYKDYFDNTYVHETLHQIGFRSSGGTMITEGIVDALTDLILCEANIKSVPTEIYIDIRTLGYQILIADKDIAKFYLETSNPNIVKRINDRLENVKKPFENEKPGKRLEDLSIGLTNDMFIDFDIFYVAFEAQEIVRAYCQSFNLEHKEIDAIREIYLVEDYENISIEQDDYGYQFFIE